MNNSHIVREVAHQFGLHFTPYLISVQAYVYHGAKLLASAETKKTPFTFSPRFSQWVNFGRLNSQLLPPLKLSQLPLEARVCFSVVIHAAHGG